MIKDFKELSQEQIDSSLCHFSHFERENVPYEHFLSWMKASHKNLNQTQIVSFFFEASKKVEPESDADCRLTNTFSEYFLELKNKQQYLLQNKKDLCHSRQAYSMNPDSMQRNVKEDSFMNVICLCDTHAKKQESIQSLFDGYINDIANSVTQSVGHPNMRQADRYTQSC